MPGNELRDELQAIPGVASAKVTYTDDAPVARIWLDGSRDAEEVREKVNALLGRTLPDRPGSTPARVKRKSGLGRGLTDLIGEDDSVPSHIDGASVPSPSTSSLRSVGVVESDEGVSVDIEDKAGAKRSVPIGDTGSIDEAVIAAVFSLYGLSVDTEIELQDLEGPDGDVVVATVHHASGDRVAGASFVDFGRPWAVARAIEQAIAAF